MERARGRGWPLAILIGIVVVVLVVIVAPVAASFAAQEDEIESARQDLATYRAEIASRPALEAQLAAMNTREASMAGLLRGDSTALAAAAMQSRVTALVQRHSGQVRSVQNLPPVAVGALERVEVQFDLSAPQGSLKSVLYQIETGSPFLYIDRVDVHPEEGSTPDSPMAAPRDLHLEILVGGYRWAGGR